MNEDEIVEKIMVKTGKTHDEVMEAAETKVNQLSGLISKEGALILVAKDNGLNIVNNPYQSKVTVEEPEETVSVASPGSDEELSLDDLGKKFIKNPKVGEHIEFVLGKIKKSKDINAVDKSGKSFKTNLTSVDYKMVYESTSGEEYCPKSWEVVGKINGVCKKLGKISGVHLRVTHIKDGMKEKEGDSYKVESNIDGKFKVLDRKTNNWA